MLDVQLSLQHHNRSTTTQAQLLIHTRHFVPLQRLLPSTLFPSI